LTKTAIIGAGLPLLVFSALVTACGGDAGSDLAIPPDGVGVVVNTPAGTATLLPVRTPDPSPTPSPTPLKVCDANPDPASPKLLQVEEPKPEQKVKVPFHVRGWGSNIAFENRGVAVAVVNAKQEVLQVLDLPPQPRTYRFPPPGIEITENTAPFAADVVIQNIKEPTAFCLWVYQETTVEGQPRGVVQVPIILVP